jgi:nitrous oxidase accessory protein NosD
MTKKIMPMFRIICLALIISFILQATGTVLAEGETPTEATPLETATPVATETEAEPPPTDTATPIATESTGGSPETGEPIQQVVESLDTTDSVLIGEDGNPIPLTTEAAAEILSTPLPDPVVCPAGSTSESDPGCVPGYTTITSAIAAAAPGSVIFVLPGTFNEQVVIDKSLTLVGSGTGTTFIQAPGSMIADGGYYSIVNVNGATTAVEMSGFTIAGPGPTGCGSLHYGIYVHGGAYADIHDNVITAIRDNPLGGCQNGVAIAVKQGGTATVENNQINDFQKGGVVISGVGSDADIIGNTIIGVGPTNKIAGNVVQISSGATGSIVNNTINASEYTTTPDWTSTGILLFSPGSGVVVTGNSLTGDQVGIYAYGANNSTICDNIVNGSSWDAVDIYASSVVNFCRNIITGAKDNGVWIGASSNISVTDNVLTNNGNGPLPGGVTDPGAGGIQVDAGTVLASLLIKNNTFMGNRYGVFNNIPSLGDVDATGNYWGCPDGPSSTSCDPVSARVLYDPILTDDPLATPIPTETPATGEKSVAGGLGLDLNCKSFNIYRLPNDDQVVLRGLCMYKAILTHFTDKALTELKRDIPDGSTYISALDARVVNKIDGAELDKLPSNTSMVVSFVVPEDLKGKNLAILYWDPTLKDNQGDWVELPAHSLNADGSTVITALHPDHTEDGKLILDGSLLQDAGSIKRENRFEATVNFSGFFALVTK